MRPTLSILIPVFNHRAYLRECIESIMNERLDSFEIIVCDDGSTDGSMESIADLPIQTISFDRNCGPAIARNALLKEARGQWISFMDSDDVLASGGLRWRIEWLRDHPQVPAVMGSLAGIIGLSKPDTAATDFTARFGSLPDVLDLSFLQKSTWIPVVPLVLTLFRRTFLEKVGLFDSAVSHAEDLDLFLRALAVESIAFKNQAVLFHRFHDRSFSCNSRDGALTLKPAAAASRWMVERAFGIGKEQSAH